eukprot:g11021.t1
MSHSDDEGVDGLDTAKEVGEETWGAVIRQLVWPQTVDMENGRGRLVSMDVLRGIAVAVMIVLHTVGGAADADYFLALDTPLATVLKIVLIPVAAPFLLGAAMRGAFAAVSGVVSGYLMHQRLGPLLAKPCLTHFYRAYAIGIVHSLVLCVVFLFLHCVNVSLNFTVIHYIGHGTLPIDQKWYMYAQSQSGPLLFFAQATILEALVLPGVFLLMHRGLEPMCRLTRQHKDVCVTIGLVVASVPFSALLSPVRQALADIRTGGSLSDYKGLAHSSSAYLMDWLDKTLYT